MLSTLSRVNCYYRVLCRSLQGIRIIQAAAGAGRTMLISDSGNVYSCGKDSFGEAEYGGQGSNVPGVDFVLFSHCFKCSC